MTGQVSAVTRLPAGLGLLLLLCWAAQVEFPLKTAAQDPERPASPSVAGLSARTRAWRLVEEAARDRDREKRAKVLRALGLLGTEPRAVELAEAGLNDKEPEVRAAAARVLGEMGSLKSVPKLVAASADKKISVAVAAAHSLLVLKSNLGYETYYEIMTG